MYSPVTEHLAMKPTGIAMAKFKGSVGFINLGNYENASFSMEADKEDVWSPQTPIRSKVGKITNELTGNISIELNQIPLAFRAAMFQSQRGLVLNQAAVTDQVILIDDAEAGRVFPTGLRNVTDLEIDGYTLNEHFAFDPATGDVEIIKHLTDVAKADIAITLSAAAVNGRPVYGPMSDMDIRGEYRFRSTNLYGPKFLYEFWDWEVQANGERNMGSNSSDQASLELEGEFYASAGKAAVLGADFTYGRITELL